MKDAGEEPWAGLCLSESLPFEFRPLAQPPSPDGLAQASAANLQTLVVEASLGESRRGLESLEADANRQSDLERLESKVDVLLGLVARFATLDRPPGGPCSVRLFAQGLEWRVERDRPQAGARGVVLLQVTPAFAQPLALHGVVAGERGGTDGPWIRFRFEGVGDRVVALLEKLIFRRHRRQVAGAHGQGSAGG